MIESVIIGGVSVAALGGLMATGYVKGVCL